MRMDSDCMPPRLAHFSVMLNNVLQTINDILKMVNALHNYQDLKTLKRTGV